MALNVKAGSVLGEYEPMRLLHLLDQWPFPSLSGARVHDKLMLKCLTEDWNAVVACWNDDDAHTAIDVPSTHVLQHRRLGWRNIVPALFSMYCRGRPLHHTEFLGRKSRRRLANIVEEINPDLIVLSSTDLASTVPFLKGITDARIVVDTHDIQLQRCQSILSTLALGDVMQRLKCWLMIRSYTLIEKGIFRDIASAWVLKEEDKKLLASYGSCDNIQIVPNVVDPDSVSVVLEDSTAIPDGPVSYAYVGKYDYKPNEQCAMMLMDWFSNGPLAASGAPLYLVGTAPSVAMRRRVLNLSNVILTGAVRSLRAYLRPVDCIFVAPILSGGGVKRKVIEAMVMGCPVLTTLVGAEGLDLCSGVTAEVCGVEEFPQRAAALAGDRNARRKMATLGQRHILARFGYEQLRESVRVAIERLPR